MIARILGSILAGLILAVPVSYLWFDREDLIVSELQDDLPRSRLLQTSDGQTHYEIRGGHWRSQIVLVHGGTVPMWLWDDYILQLDLAGYQVLRYDQFGRGLSDRLDSDYDRELHVRQLEEVLAATGWDDDPVDLVGYSLGGAIATEFTARHPERVRNLVLIAPVVDYRDQMPAPARWPLVGEYFVRTVGVPMAIGRFSDMLNKVPRLESRREDYLTQTRIGGFEDLLLSLARSDALGDYASSYQAVGQADVPTLVFHGEQDAEIGADSLAVIEAAMPHARLRGLPGAGHEVGVSRANMIMDIMIPWLKRDW